MDERAPGVAPAITTDKVLDLSPTWAPFDGWSVLFDAATRANEQSPVQPPTLFDSSGASPNERLLRGLADLASSAARLPAAAGHLAGLPASTYHVTVCDGLSRAHVDQAPALNRPAVVAVLEALPEGAVDHELLMLGSPAPLDRLLVIAEKPIRFVLTGVEVRGHALVAALDPAPGEEQAFATLDAARTDVLATLAERTGLDVVTRWRPHISLGYVANRSRIEAMHDELASLSPTVLGELGDVPFIAQGASIYTFDDMVTFWRSSPG